MRDNVATTATGTVASVFAKATDAERAVARLKAAGFGDVRLSERAGTTTKEHVDEQDGRTAADFAASLEAAGFARGDARAFTDAVASGGTLVTLAAGQRFEDALAVLRGEAVATRAISAVDVAPAAAVSDVAYRPSATGPTAEPTSAADIAPNETRTAEAPSGTIEAPSDPKVLELREERLNVEKVREESEARIRKEVVTEERTITVPVQREELVIERDGQSDIRVPISDDERLR